MKKNFLALLTVFALFGCNNSGSSDTTGENNPPPIHRDTLTFLQNKAPEYNALIFKDTTSVNDNFTSFTYAVENMTKETYNNVSFSIEPASEKYRLSKTTCTTLAYEGYCLISVFVNAKAKETINFTIKMNSDKGEKIFTPNPVKSAYIAQPKDESNADVAAISLKQNESKTFLVYNSVPYRTTLRGDILSFNERSITQFTIKPIAPDGTSGFAINIENTIKPFTIDGKKYNFKNCFAPIPPLITNETVDACFVEVSYNGTNPAADTADLSIERKTNPSATAEQIPWKYATVKLTATTN